MEYISLNACGLLGPATIPRLHRGFSEQPDTAHGREVGHHYHDRGKWAAP